MGMKHFPHMEAVRTAAAWGHPMKLPRAGQKAVQLRAHQDFNFNELKVYQLLPRAVALCGVGSSCINPSASTVVDGFLSAAWRTAASSSSWVHLGAYLQGVSRQLCGRAVV